MARPPKPRRPFSEYGAGGNSDAPLRRYWNLTTFHQVLLMPGMGTGDDVALPRSSVSWRHRNALGDIQHGIGLELFAGRHS